MGLPSGTQCYRVLKMIGQQTLQLLEQIDTPALSHHLQEPANVSFVQSIFYSFFFFLMDRDSGVRSQGEA